MFNICYRMTGSRNDAEDVLQEAFIMAFQKITQLKEDYLFGGWLKRIVISECIRFSKKSFYWDDWDENHDEKFFDDESGWWESISFELLQQEIRSLPEGCRQIFNLYVLENYSHKEIGTALNISESTSKSQYQRARQLLKERLTKKMIVNGSL